MSDAQSFYLLLAAFYLYECLTFAPRGAWGFVGRGGTKWRWRVPFFHLSGLHKEAFCAPILPYPGFQVVFPAPPNSLPEPKTLTRFRRESLRISKATRHLRFCSLLVFLHYFLFLPVAYHHWVGTPMMIAVIIQGELLAFYTAFAFHRLHKRLHPDDKWERRLETLYHAFLPWHAMRASDLIIKKGSATWHPLAALVSDPGSPSNQKQLALMWRRARHEGQSRSLQTFLEKAGIDPTPWSFPPPLDEPNKKYCPVCLAVYEEKSMTCADCTGVALISPADQSAP